MAYRFDKFTIKAQEAVQRAQSLAADRGHPQIDAVHLLAALVAETDGVVRPILDKIGANHSQLQRTIDGELGQFPKVGGGAPPQPADSLVKVFEAAARQASSMQDEFVSTEHLLLALTQTDGKAKNLLQLNALNEKAILQAMQAVRGTARVTDQTGAVLPGKTVKKGQVIFHLLPLLTPEGRANLAPYSFFNAVSYVPPQVIFSGGARPDRRGAPGFIKDSVANARATGEFVFNLVTRDLAERMNATSRECPPGVDEFALGGLTKAPSVLVKPPRVAESPVHFECKVVDVIATRARPGGQPNELVLGEVVGVHIDERVLTDGVFHMAKELYGITLKERTDLPVYQEDVRVFEVFDTDGKPLGLFLADFYARSGACGGKRSTHRLAQAVEEGHQAARRAVADFLRAETPNEVVFTSGTTEAANLVARGFPYEDSRREVVITDLEHNAVALPFIEAARRGDIELKICPTEDGALDLNRLEALLSGVSEALDEDRTEEDIFVPFADGRARARLHEEGIVLSEREAEGGHIVRVRWTARQKARWRSGPPPSPG